MKRLAELLRIIPEFYVHNWEVIKGNTVCILGIPKDFEKNIITIPRDLLPLAIAQKIAIQITQTTNKFMPEIVLNERKVILKRRLLCVIMKSYELFLAKEDVLDNGLEEVHPLFEIESVCLDDVINLKEIPAMQKIETVSDCVKKNKEIVQKAVDVKIRAEQMQKESTPSSNLSKKLLKQFRKKEIENKVTKEILEQRAKDFRPLCERDTVLHLAEVLKVLSTQRSTLIPLEIIIEKLTDLDGGFILSRGKCKNKSR